MPSTPKKNPQGKQNKSKNQGKASTQSVIAGGNGPLAKDPVRPVAGITQYFNFLQYLSNVWVFIPAVFYFILVSQYATNAPIKDDYDAILDFMVQYTQAPTLGAKAVLLFSQHNEHRILSTHLLTVLYYSIAGKINFRDLIFIGNFQLILIFLVSIQFIRQCLSKYWNVAAFLWGLCLFDPSSYENGDVTMTSLQNFGIVMLFLLSLYFYGLQKGKWIIPAVIFQFFCLFSSGNGILGALIIAVFTLFSGDKRKIIPSFTILLIFSPLYFYHYVTPPPVPGPKQVISLATAIPYFFKMTGAHYNFQYSLYFGILTVIVLLLCLPYRKKILFNKEVLPMICLLIFLLITEGIIALMRNATQVFYGSRYLIYPHLIAAITFLFLLKKLMDRNVLWPVFLVFSGMVYAYSNNYRYGLAGFERESTRAEQMDYYFPDKARARIIATNACQAGIYCIQEDK